MEAILLELVSSHPAVASVLMGIGVLRAIFKPLMTVLDKYVESTPSAKDDEKLAKFYSSKAYKVVAWILDYTASIKLPKKK